MLEDKATQSVIDRDPALSGLAILLSPDTLAARLEQALQAQVTVQKLSYLRYKPGQSCRAGYQLVIDGQARMISIRAYHRDSNKYQKALQTLPKVSKPVPGVIAFDDERLIVNSFPSDPELPAISQLMSADTSPQLLSKLLPQDLQLQQASITTLRYKPARRLVGRLDNDGLPKALIKIYNDKDFQQALTAIRNNRPGNYKLAKLLGFSRRSRIVASQWLSGDPLNSLWTTEVRATKGMQQTAEALYGFHGQTGNRLSLLKPDTLIQSLVMLAHDLSFILPDLEPRVMALAQALAKELKELPEVFVPIHGDFSSDQVICHKDKIAIIDLDEARLGHPAYDLGIFVAQLRREAIFERLRPQSVTLFCNTFLDSYPARLPAVELFTALGLFRLAPHCFRQQLHNWSHKSELLIAAAEQALQRYKQTV